MRSARGRAALAVLLSACGAARPAAEERFELSVERVTGGAYVAGCSAEADRVVLARSWRLERWHLPEDGTPTLTGRLDVGRPGEAPPVVALGCRAERVRIQTLAGELGAEGSAVTWRGTAPPEWPEVAASTAEAPHRGRLALGGARELVFGDWGRGVRREGRFLDWRATAGDLADAAFDGRVVWAAGASGLWRWTPGPGEPTPVPLPEGLAGRPLVEVFRDGPFLQVRAADGTGWALDVSGPVARAVSEPGRLAPSPEAPVRAIAGSVYLEGAPGSARLRVIRRDDDLLLTVWEAPGAVHALLPVGPVLLVAAGDEVLALRFDDLGEARVLARLRLDGPTRRMFVQGDRVWLVGARYGIAEVRITPSS